MSDSATPIDFVSEPAPSAPVMQPIPQGVPITAPSPVQAPPYNGHAKQLMKLGEPVVQETVTRQTIGPRSSMPDSSPGVMNSAGRQTVDLLQSIVNDPECQNYTIQVERNGPARFSGVMFPVGPIESISPPMCYRDVYERVREIHGGGKYTLRILNENGVPQRATVAIAIDCNAYPPIPLQPMQQHGQTVQPRVIGGLPNGLGGNEELAKVREAESLARAKQQAAQAEWGFEDAQVARERRKEQQAELDARRSQMPELATVRSEIKDITTAMDRRMEQMQNNFEKTIALIVANNKPAADNGMMAVVLTMMKSMSDSNTAIITALASKKDDGGGTAMQMMMQSNEKVAQMAIQNANQMLTAAASQSGKHEKLLETMIVSKLEHPDKAVEQALELRQSGWKQAMEMVEMMDERRGGRDTEEVIDPENGFFSNLGNVILNMLQGFASSGAKGAGKTILSAIGAGLGKPTGQPLSQADLLKAAQIMERQQLQQQGRLPQQPVQRLPQPRPVQQLVQRPVQQQAQRPVQRNTGAAVHWFNAWYEADALVAVEPQVKLELEQEVVNEEVVPPIEQPAERVEEVTEQVEETVSTPAPVETVEEVNTDNLSPLQVEINEALLIMKNDLIRKIREQEWVDYALNKWDGDFLTSLVEAADDNQRTVMIRQLADPTLWQEIETMLLTNTKKYELYVLNMQTLVQLVRNPETSNA